MVLRLVVGVLQRSDQRRLVMVVVRVPDVPADVLQELGDRWVTWEPREAGR